MTIQIVQDIQDKWIMKAEGKGAGLFALLVFITLTLAGCGGTNEGTVSLADKSYRVSAIIGPDSDGFDAPDGILWNEGKLYMADEGGPAVRIWSDPKNVKTLSNSGNGIMSPEDLVLDPDGNIFFTDDDAGGVWKIDREGKIALLAGKERGLVSTEGIALAPSGEILVGDGKQHKIFSVRQNGEVSVFLDAGITKPESMVFDEQGNLYIGDNVDQVVYRLSPDKKLTRVIQNRQDFSPESMWYSGGVLYITDSDYGKLLRYDPKNGVKIIASFGGAFRKVCGVTTDDRENIYLSIQTHIDNKIGYIIRLERN